MIGSYGEVGVLGLPMVIELGVFGVPMVLGVSGVPVVSWVCLGFLW